MALLTEGGSAVHCVYKHGPPDGGKYFTTKQKGSRWSGLLYETCWPFETKPACNKGRSIFSNTELIRGSIIGKKEFYETNLRSYSCRPGCSRPDRRAGACRVGGRECFRASRRHGLRGDSSATLGYCGCGAGADRRGDRWADSRPLRRSYRHR